MKKIAALLTAFAMILGSIPAITSADEVVASTPTVTAPVVASTPTVTAPVIAPVVPPRTKRL